MANETDNGAKLTQLLGFDAAKEPGITNDVFSAALKEINEERALKGKARAKEVLAKAMELRQQMVKHRRDFEKQYSKFDKDLGKLIRQIEAGINGQPVPEEPEEQQAPTT